MVAVQRILVVDDEEEVRDWLQSLLQEAGFAVSVVADGSAMRTALATDAYALLVLDLRLKGEDGLQLARAWRQKSVMPIIMMSGKGDETDRVLGLEIAADDYLTKPFSGREFLARVRVALRRACGQSPPGHSPGEAHECYHFAGWMLDMSTHSLLQPDGRPCALTRGELLLLAALVRHPCRIWSREQLLAQTRGLDCDVFDRTIDVLILRLRRKIEANPRCPQLICTERGAGYLFKASVWRS